MNPISPRELARRLPDHPALIDLRGPLLDGRCRVFPEHPAPGEGFVVVVDDIPYANVHGVPAADAVRAAVDHAEPSHPANDEWHLLAPPEAADAVAEALEGRTETWARRAVKIHRWPAEGRDELARLGHLGGVPEVAAGNVEIHLAPDGHAAAGFDLDHLPAALRREMEGPAVRTRPLAAALVDGRAVAFCHAPLFTESLWDVAVDTLPAYRRRGLAALCFRRLAGHLWRRRGLTPVWGALVENTASMGLAARLGFLPVADLVSFRRES